MAAYTLSYLKKPAMAWAKVPEDNQDYWRVDLDAAFLEVCVSVCAWRAFPFSIWPHDSLLWSTRFRAESHLPPFLRNRDASVAARC